MSRAAKRDESDQVDGPARITPMHRQERPLFDEKSGREIVGKRGYSNETQLERFLRLNQHICKASCTDKKATDVEIERALDRRDAGKDFAQAWAEREPGSRDSTDPSPRGGATADGLTTAMIAASKKLHGWQAHMGGNDWMLVMRVCGQDLEVARAVAEISPGYRDTAPARFREALTALHAAGIAAGKCQWCRMNKPHGSVLEAFT
jgi:hypothetical protein